MNTDIIMELGPGMIAGIVLVVGGIGYFLLLSFSDSSGKSKRGSRLEMPKDQLNVPPSEPIVKETPIEPQPASNATAQEPVVQQQSMPVAAQSDPVFDRDKFLLRQKHLAINEKYHVWDELEKPILFVERPMHVFRNVFAGVIGFILGFVVLLGVGFVAVSLSDPNLQIAGYAGAMAGAFFVTILVTCLFSKKRHVTFYKDDSKSEPLLKIEQDRKIQVLKSTYTVKDTNDQFVAKFRKNTLSNILRKRWYCYGEDKTLICEAVEDSFMKALLRRILGSFFGLLKTNFIITSGSDHAVLGEFNRKFTLLDRYVLDMSADPNRLLDRRIALALGVLLDTGEKR